MTTLLIIVCLILVFLYRRERRRRLKALARVEFWYRWYKQQNPHGNPPPDFGITNDAGTISGVWDLSVGKL